jgi:hypothetical protein
MMSVPASKRERAPVQRSKINGTIAALNHDRNRGCSGEIAAISAKGPVWRISLKKSANVAAPVSLRSRKLAVWRLLSSYRWSPMVFKSFLVLSGRFWIDISSLTSFRKF